MKEMDDLLCQYKIKIGYRTSSIRSRWGTTNVGFMVSTRWQKWTTSEGNEDIDYIIGRKSEDRCYRKAWWLASIDNNGNEKIVHPLLALILIEQ